MERDKAQKIAQILGATHIPTGTCWSGSEVYCKHCGGPTEAGEDEYGGLAGGGDYERFICRVCKLVTYVELPD